MGCILTKVCLGEDLLQLGDAAAPEQQQELQPSSHRLSRAKTTLLVLDPNDVSSAAGLPHTEDFHAKEVPTEVRNDTLVYGGGVPGVALDAERVELPEFTGIRDGGYRSRKDTSATFFSVFDGHGPQGAFVSHFVRENYHRAIAEAYLELIPRASSGAASGVARNASVTCDVIAEVFQTAARTTVNRLGASNIDISVSGTTAVGMLVCEKDVFIANIGDSRAIIARYSEDESTYVLHCETKDHKPNLPEERARIERSNGRVFEWGSYRVWLQDVDMPGLAMSRSFGDSVAKTVGVTAEPDVSTVEKLDFSSSRKKGERPTAFAVLASDGIWEFMTTDECIDFVAVCIAEPGMSAQEACTALVEEAYDRWDAEEDVVDDITVALVYF
ncbi:hypothetical protein BBJ29_002817 [Phytophthora kernoviae]|uniref:PPM-type phosphatase domain-containing protein n=1 Tax=Phytophthora kernoviae TaxID=325452 RepID=A0A3F2RQ48_9STRA|nr:hypothetical protein BBJ29_002817 [Phytophthora kernoviae]RLN61993.1 hypothetical protein BBP00_00005044 [Phytophthora kernoviae]